MRVPRLVLVGSILVALGAPTIAIASAGFSLGPAITASGASPFAGCTFGGDPDADPTPSSYTGTEVEPFVAVNPTNLDNIIGAYQQDRWTDGGSRGLVASRSNDGGATWTRNWAAFSKCEGGSHYARATDPWVSFDSAGRAYQISLGIDNATLVASDVEAATSTDGGATWSSPVQLINDTTGVKFNDKQSITGDWRPVAGAGKAYATWIVGSLPGSENISPAGAGHSFAYGGQPVFTKTTDGGATWSTPTTISNAVVYVQGNQIVVLPDGTLVDVGAMLFKGSRIQPTPQAYFWTAFVSKNGGKTWGAPIKIAPLGTQLLTNPDITNPTSLNETIRAGDYIPDVAVDHATGAIYMVFADGISTGFDHVKLTKSLDSGKTWSKPIDVTQTPAGTHSFNGTVEVTSDGTVAVMYYDFRNNTGDPGLPTDVWLTHSHDGGASWSEQHLYGSFDMENAPVARGWFLGDYQGMAAAGNDLITFFAVATTNDQSDVISIRADAP
ncbi:MAG: exo-alpha-sialidase [Chloroflexi bacterium]|nr:exo-alpha-sialidase [Chloroflexota bacterium]